MPSEVCLDSMKVGGALFTRFIVEFRKIETSRFECIEVSGEMELRYIVDRY